MNLITYNIFLMTLVTILLTLNAGPAMAEVYKTVDEHGNVVYTDTPPVDGSTPMDLPPISVIETPSYEKTSRQKTEDAIASGAQPEETPLRTLRRNYSGFSIVSPKAEASLWHPEGPVEVVWSSARALQEGMRVTVYVDGKQIATSIDAIIPVSDLERGEHIVTAEITDARNRKIATADPVTFFIRQPGIANRRAAGPGGGG